MSIEVGDFISQKRYKISGILGAVVHQGYLIRQKQVFKQFLNTKDGIKRFLETQQPFEELKVYDLLTQEEITEEFMEGEG